MAAGSRGALDGFRVVETGGLRTALAGRFLADLGAEVLWVEPPGGDPARRVPPFSATEPGRSLFFEYYAAGKTSVVADRASRREREALADLVADADVWLDATAPGERCRFGLDEPRLLAANPRLVHASVTPFGRSGPFATWRANDLVAQAAGGMAFTNGHADGSPLQGFGLQALHAASAYALIGVLLALLDRERTGRGQQVEISIQEAVAGAVEEASAAWNAERRISRRQGTLHWSRFFHLGRTRDGWVLECTLGDWTSLREWLRDGGVEGFDGPEWEETAFRRDHAEELFAAIDRWCAERSAGEILEGAQLRRLAFGAVRPVSALRRDEQLAAREFFAALPGSESWGAIRFPGPPFRMSSSPMRTRRAAPVLGSAAWPRRGRLFPKATQTLASEPPHRALEGVRVLDFTHVVAGPVATRILADHGADVIKIERRTTLDQGDRRRGLFSNLNRGKRSVILDLATEAGLDAARRLAAKSDVVIDNFSARVMPNLGLDYEKLRELRRDVIAVSMSGFGKTGPARDFVSFGPTLQALCGHTLLMRHPGGEPAGWGFSHADMVGGLNGAIAVLAALVHRARTGVGQRVDLAQYESVVSFMGPVLLDVVENGAEPAPAANRSQAKPCAPHGIYPCAGSDRWVAIAVEDDEDWRRFGVAVAEPWTREAKYRDVVGRLAWIEALDAAVAAWTSARSPEEVTALLQTHGLAAFTVANGEDLCARDPHLQMRGSWARLPHEDGGAGVVDGTPVRLSRTPGGPVALGPRHGEHTDEVLTEVAGSSAEEIVALRAAGILG